MAAQYPAALPTQPTRGATKGAATTETDIQDDLYAELIAIATELGVNPSASSASVGQRIGELDRLFPLCRIIGPFGTNGPTTFSVLNLASGRYGRQVWRIQGSPFGIADPVPSSQISIDMGSSQDRLLIQVPSSGPWYFMFLSMPASATVLQAP